MQIYHVLLFINLVAHARKLLEFSDIFFTW